VGAELSVSRKLGRTQFPGERSRSGRADENRVRLDALSRRVFILAALGSLVAPAAAQCRRTPGSSAGPFYLAGQPEQADLCIRSQAPGLIVSGRVSAFPECRPVANAVIDVWHADGRGRYTRMDKIVEDDAACLLRGRIRTDVEGRYAFRTLAPGVHLERPRQIHYRVSAPGYRTLATQMYLPPQNNVDPQLVGRVLEPLEEGGAGRIVFDLTLAPR
jgi:protocatechuate 3,4-dioxygenase beta subunit